MKTPAPSPQPSTGQSPPEESGPVPPPSPVGRVFGIVLVVLTLGGMYWTFFNATMSSGYVGTQGKLVISKCVEDHKESRSTRGGTVAYQTTCHGTFRSDDGDVVDRSAQITLSKNGADSEAAKKVADEHAGELSVNRAGNGTLSITNVESVANYLCGGFFFLLVFAYGFKCALTGSFPKKGIGPSSKQADQLIPKPLKATEEWLWVIGGIGLVLAILFRLAVGIFGMATLPFQ
ncbi:MULTISPECIES: hypothetical protein [unclassified Streptomyces]|uniref:hypothetical protein n=1 Tax=unclassified Streptomyces TaxID=2593676 RepID=UPI00278BCFA0|nr:MULTISPECIES: hypothetical protein [unclassified Streptomyces]